MQPNPWRQIWAWFLIIIKHQLLLMAKYYPWLTITVTSIIYHTNPYYHYCLFIIPDILELWWFLLQVQGCLCTLWSHGTIGVGSAGVMVFWPESIRGHSFFGLSAVYAGVVPASISYQSSLSSAGLWAGVSYILDSLVLLSLFYQLAALAACLSLSPFPLPP